MLVLEPMHESRGFQQLPRTQRMFMLLHKIFLSLENCRKLFQSFLAFCTYDEALRESLSYQEAIFNIKGHSVLLATDNTTVTAYINKQRGESLLALV